MSYLLTIIKGMVIGIANIIPGVSGGTMAVSLGIYDDMIFSITNLFKKWKQSLQTLGPILIGAAAGIIGFTYIIEFLLSDYTLPTALAFIGLILGGLPVLKRAFTASMYRKEEKKLTIGHIITFLVFFIISIGLPLLQESSGTSAVFETNASTLIKLLFVGIITSATMVVPGVSGSLILMILGYYYGIVDMVTVFIDALRSWNLDVLIPNFILLSVFGVGVLLGIFLISKVIEYLFEHYASLTYSGIFGLVLASPFTILYNTNALGDLNSPQAIPFLLIGVILMFVCFFVTYYLGENE